MTVRLRRFVLVGLVMGITFFAGAFTAATRGWGSPLVTVVVHNSTASPLRSVEVRYTTCSETRSLHAASSDIAPGESSVVRFLVCGEGGYTMEVVLADGSKLTSGGYVEAGYYTNMYVEPKRVRSEDRFF